MPVNFFSPKKTQDGAALYVSFNSKDAALFFKLIQQTGWDDAKKKGSFQGGEYINVKFSPDEIGDFIQAIRNKSEAKFYHSFGDDTTTGTLKYYIVPAKTEGQRDKEGFGIKVKRGDVEYKVGLTLGAAERLMEYLRFALDHIFSAIYAADKKDAEEYNKAKAQKEKAASTKKKEPSPQPEPEEPGEVQEQEEEEENDF